MALWTAADAVAATGGQASAEWTATGVSIDTRTLNPGDLFVALKAARDGHDFVAQAFEKGAAAALVSHIPDGVAPDAPLLIVPDVLKGLEALGIAARARTKARVVGITGSVGKTSAKEMLREVLTRQGRTHAAEASYNNHWGVPLTLARMPEETEFAVIEIGMNAPGEIAPLSRMARPHVAMVTSVAAVHLEAFDSVAGIAHEKASILDGLQPGGMAILNGDVEHSPILQAKAAEVGARQILFGETAPDYRLTDVRVTDAATIVQAQAFGTPLLFKIATPGRHLAMNGLGVLAAAAALGADPGRAANDIAYWHPPAGRGTREQLVLDAIDGLAFELIDDAFNANPTSLGAALEVLAAAATADDVGRIARGRRIAILGDMLELGPDELAMHAAIADSPYIAKVDKVHCVGPLMKALWDALPEAKRGQWSETAEALLPRAASLIDAGDVVLVKGSKGIKVSRIVDALRKLGQPQPQENKGIE